MTKKHSIGIIGTGFGKIIGLNFRAVDPNINLYFAGRNKEKTEQTAAELSASGTFNNWQDLIKDPKIDLVVIASISSLHKKMFLETAKAGKNILIEKPAALLYSDIDEMIKVFGTKNKIAVVNHEGRFHPVITYIKKLIESDKLGDIMTIRIGTYTNWYSNPEYKENWNNDKSLGGGQIPSIGSHQIDLARYLLGKLEIISGSVQDIVYKDPRFIKKPTAESQFSAHFKTSQNTSIQIFNDCYCFGYKDFTIDVVGSKGVVIYSDLRGLKTSFSNSEPMQDVTLEDPLSEITYGNSMLTKSMKYMVKALIDYLNEHKIDNRFCTLEHEKENLKIFEDFK